MYELKTISTTNMGALVCHLIDSNIGSDYFTSIARHHNTDRYPVVIGSIAPPGRLQDSMNSMGVPTFSLEAIDRWRYPAASVKLARLLRRQRVNILHAHCFDPTLIGLAAARLTGVEFVFTRHHSDHHLRLGKQWHTAVDAWCARKADHVIAVSGATKHIMLEIEGVPDRQITVVHNGMEPLRPAPADEVAGVRRELGLGGEPVCLMAARLHEEKGHRFLFEAVPAIQAECGKVSFLLAGDGPDRAQLEREVFERGLQESVRFLGRRNDMPALISLASMVVLPSLAESFGFALLEAMWLGKPVVASNVGGIPEIVQDSKTGLLVPPGRAADLVEAVTAVLRNLELAHALGQAGRARAEIFSIERMIRGYEEVYDGLAGSKTEPERTTLQTHEPRLNTPDSYRPIQR